MERFSEVFACGMGAVKLSLDFWRSCGCLLVGLDEEDLVRGRIENFNKCSPERE